LNASADVKPLVRDVFNLAAVSVGVRLE
jgi:hypothetical protein